MAKQTPKIDRLELCEVEYMPEEFKPGVLYHSSRFNTAIHLCACGCGNKTVTPLAETKFIPDRWGFSVGNNGPTLEGSIGNQNVCGSHYNVVDGKIDWLSPRPTHYKMSSGRIEYL